MATKGPLRQLFAFSMALLLVSAGAFAVVEIGAVDREDASLAQPGDALLVAGAAIAGVAIGTGVGYYAADYFQSSGEVASQEEALQQKIDLFQLASTQAENSEVITTQTANRLPDSDTPLKMEAMNELVQHASGDSTQSEAETAVTNRVDNRTTVKQINVLNAWNAAAENVRYIENVTDNSSGLSSSFADPTITHGAITGADASDITQDVTATAAQTRTTSYTLHNGTTHTVTEIGVTISESGSGDGQYGNLADETKTIWITPYDHSPTSMSLSYTFDGGSPNSYSVADIDYSGYKVTRNESAEADTFLESSNDEVIAVASEFGSVLDTIDQQNNQAIQAVTDLAAVEYSSLRDGTISINETITPYYADHLYNTEGNDSSAWLLNMEASLGSATPEELDTVMRMTVDHNGTELNGMLMSDGLPPNGTFETGVQYDPANLSGNQFVITDDGSKPELTDPFSITQIENSDGTNSTTITYEQPTYNVTTIDGFRNQTKHLLEIRAESEAREQNKEGGSGGGAIFEGSGSVAIVVVALLAVAAMVRSNGGGGRGRY